MGVAVFPAVMKSSALASDPDLVERTELEVVVYFTVIVLPVCNGYDYFLCCIMIASLGYKTCMQLS